MMKRTVTFLALCLMMSAAYAAEPSRTPGAKLGGSSGIAVMYLTVLADGPGEALLRFSARHYFGPIDQIKVELGSTTLIVRDMYEGQYGFYDLLSTSTAWKTKLREALPEFQVKAGCMIYVGEITLDIRGKKPQVSYERKAEDRVASDLKERYPDELAKYGGCT